MRWRNYVFLVKSPRQARRNEATSNNKKHRHDESQSAWGFGVPTGHSERVFLANHSGAAFGKPTPFEVLLPKNLPFDYFAKGDNNDAVKKLNPRALSA